MKKRSIITIAVGKPYYLKLAENLLKSFLIWNGGDIFFLLLTDNISFFEKYKGFANVGIELIQLEDEDKSFTSKFKLVDHMIAEENIFIDCDCLIYHDLGPVFSAFQDKNFSAIGHALTDGEFFGNVKAIMKQFHISNMPHFVGSLYYFKNNSRARQIFEKAIELKARYDQLGLVRLRGRENEEPLFSIAMALYGETVLPDDRNIKVDLMYYEKISSNVITGKAQAKGPIKTLMIGSSYPESTHPFILHFNGHFSDGFNYRSESFRLNHAGTNRFLLESAVYLGLYLPEVFINALKRSLRPAYNRMLGYRRIKKSDRLD